MKPRSTWWPAVGLVLLSAVPVFFGAVRVHQLASDAAITPENARFFARPLPVVLHIASATLFSIGGAFQFVPVLREHAGGWHRRVGALLLGSGFVVALSGLWMTQFYPWPEGDGQLLYLIRLVVGTAMLIYLGLAVRAILRREFKEHGAWMTRAYALGLGAATQVFTHLPYLVLSSGRPPELPRALMMAAGWAINLGVAEWLLRTPDVGANDKLARG